MRVKGTRATSQAVLFDLDGTLHDSNGAWQEAMGAYVTRYTDEPGPGLIAGLVGMSTPEAVALVHGRLGLPPADVSADVAWLEERVARTFAEQAAWHPGALELVGRTREAGLRTALVTSSGRLIVDSLLGGPIGRLFDVVVCSADVERMKPAPDPYLLAASLLGVDPADCVAVEDSATGVASAAAAGCRVIYIGAAELAGSPVQAAQPDRARLDVSLLLRILADVSGEEVSGGRVPG